MLKKLFSRKSPKTAQLANKPNTSPSTAPQTEETLEHWVSAIQAEHGKARTQKIAGLVDQIRQRRFTAEAARAALPENVALMVAIELELPVDDVRENQWVELVTEGFSARVRKEAASHITQSEQLDDLVKQTKGRDKSVYRILHATQERLQSEQKARQAQAVKQQAVLEAIEKLAGAPIEPMYDAKLKGLADQWRDLKVTDTDAVARFDSAHQRAQAKIDELRQQEQNVQNHEEFVGMADENRQSLIAELTDRFNQRLSEGELSESAHSDDQHLLTQIQHKWQEIEQTTRATKEESRSFQKTCTAFEVGLARFHRLLSEHGSLDQIQQKLHQTDGNSEALLHEIDDWLHEIDNILAEQKPETVKALQQALDAHQQSLAEHRQQEIQRVRAIRGQLRRCLQAVEEGSLRRASGLYHGAQEKLEGFDLKAHGGVRKQLEETTAALEQLRDWQSYAVLPKKEALIRRMSALVEQSVDPEYRAQTIREMQDEWKLLSRGLQDRQQDLWETFHDLAQKAYEPCREYFSEQKHLRDVNLERRREIIDQLSRYAESINWEQPDIKEVDRVLQVARNDWRHYSPVDRVANKTVQAEFDKIHQSIFQKMRQEQAVFRENKEAIIAKARALLDNEDIKSATDQAKALQREWKSAGMVARKDEQQLWKAFREVCDELFARRDEQISAFKADLETNRQQAEEVLTAMAELIDDADVLAQSSVFENLKSRFENIGTLPKAQYSTLTGKFRETCQAFEARCREAKAAQADQHWEALIDWVRQARFEGASAEQLADEWQKLTVPEPARSLVDAIPAWLEPSSEMNQTAMHEKTIDLEIMTGVESPQEDADIRMNLQVQHLSQGIGTQVSVAQVHQTVVDWLAIGAVPADDYRRFEARMIAARKSWLR